LPSVHTRSIPDLAAKRRRTERQSRTVREVQAEGPTLRARADATILASLGGIAHRPTLMTRVGATLTGIATIPLPPRNIG
jgi:hypothetical protein